MGKAIFPSLFKTILNYAHLTFISKSISDRLYFCTSRMTQNFKALALTYRTAPVAIREQVSLNETAAKKFINSLGIILLRLTSLLFLLATGLRYII